ncbi:hypothetical protein Ahia01_001176100, partial [Argonauta hians]
NNNNNNNNPHHHHHQQQLHHTTSSSSSSNNNSGGNSSSSSGGGGGRKCHECEIWRKMTAETVTQLATKEAQCELHLHRVAHLEKKLSESVQQVSSLTEALHTRSSDCQQYVQRIKTLETQLLHILQQQQQQLLEEEEDDSVVILQQQQHHQQQQQQKASHQMQHHHHQHQHQMHITTIATSPPSAPSLQQQQQQQLQQHRQVTSEVNMAAAIAGHSRSESNQFSNSLPYEFGRPRAGFGISKTMVDKYKMIDIGEGLYVHPDDLAVVLSKADGQKMVRKLMNIVFKKEDLEQGATLSPTGKGKLLDQRVVDVMLAWVLMNQSTMWSRGSLRQAINRKLTSYRCRSLKKKHEAGELHH